MTDNILPNYDLVRLSAELAAVKRELEIETSVERVRGKAMAMRTSDDVCEVICMAYNELNQLSESLFWVSYYTYDPETREMTSWPQMLGQATVRPFRMPRIDHPFHDRYIDAFENQIPFYSYRLEGEGKATCDPLLFSETDYKNMPDDMREMMMSMTSIVSNNAVYRNSLLQAATTDELEPEAKALLERFVPMFDLTYIRSPKLPADRASGRIRGISMTRTKCSRSS